jgi:hypothetical protein
MSALIHNKYWAAGMWAQLDTSEVSDVGSTRTVLAITVFLLVAAVVLAGVTVWYWRSTVPDPEALASLVELSDNHKRSKLRLRRNTESG